MKKSSFTKRDLVKNLSKKKGFSINFSNKLINDLLNVLTNIIKAEGLNLKNIGKFKLKKKSQRFGRNPKTKEEFIITSRNSISFIASKKLLEIVNRKL